MDDRAAGEIMLNEVFKMVEQLNAAAGPSMVTKGARSGNMTFNPKIVVDEYSHKRYTCFIEINTSINSEAGTEIDMEWSSATIEQFKQTMPTVLIALSGLAQEGFVSDMYTVGRITPNGEETEVYAPEVLEPGMYSLREDEE